MLIKRHEAVILHWEQDVHRPKTLYLIFYEKTMIISESLKQKWIQKTKSEHRKKLMELLFELSTGRCRRSFELCHNLNTIHQKVVAEKRLSWFNDGINHSTKTNSIFHFFLQRWRINCDKNSKTKSILGKCGDRYKSLLNLFVLKLFLFHFINPHNFDSASIWIVFNGNTLNEYLVLKTVQRTKSTTHNSINQVSSMISYEDKIR